RIEITPYTEVSSNNKILLERLERKFKNLNCNLDYQFLNVGKAINSTIDNLNTEYLLILSPGNQVSRSNLKRLLKELPHIASDIVLNEPNNLINSKKETYTDSLESGIFNLDFIKNKQINFDEEINIINNSFLIEALDNVETISYLSYHLVNKMNDGDKYNSSNTYLLEEYKKIEEKIVDRKSVV